MYWTFYEIWTKIIKDTTKKRLEPLIVVVLHESSAFIYNFEQAHRAAYVLKIRILNVSNYTKLQYICDIIDHLFGRISIQTTTLSQCRHLSRRSNRGRVWGQVWDGTGGVALGWTWQWIWGLIWSRIGGWTEVRIGVRR